MSDEPACAGRACANMGTCRGRPSCVAMHAPVEGAAMASYLPYEPMQQMLLPEALQDWLPEGHLAYFISDTVDGLDLQAFHARYASGGPRNQPFHPHE